MPFVKMTPPVPASRTQARSSADAETRLLRIGVATAQKLASNAALACLRLSASLAETKTELCTVKDQLASMKRRAEAAERALDQHLRTQQAIKVTFSYRVGHVLIFGFKSFSGFVRMPGMLFGIWRDARAWRRMNRDRPSKLPSENVA
jgi:hypothetical protein